MKYNISEINWKDWKQKSTEWEYKEESKIKKWKEGRKEGRKEGSKKGQHAEK